MYIYFYVSMHIMQTRILSWVGRVLRRKIQKLIFSCWLPFTCHKILSKTLLLCHIPHSLSCLFKLWVLIVSGFLLHTLRFLHSNFLNIPWASKHYCNANNKLYIIITWVILEIWVTKLKWMWLLVHKAVCL